LIGLLAWIGGCGQSPRSSDHAEVSGKVLINGKPLPGGQISFVAAKGGFAASGNIDENGLYKINAPVGEVTITVNNTSLQSQQGQSGQPSRKGGVKGGGGGAPKELPHTKQAAAEEHAPKGHWVSLPSRYSNADTSDLKYTVTAGSQTHDVQLSSSAPPPK
jgi:hypothetical protein